MLGTLTRAGEVLDLFTMEHPEWGVTEAAARLGIPKSKAHNTLTSLVEIGLLQRGAHGRYRLGWRTVSLASTALCTAALTTRGGSLMKDLAAAVRGTVHLLAHDHLRVVCVDRRHLRGATPSPPSVGRLVPFDGAPGGLVLLAHGDRQALRTLWAAGEICTGHPALEDLEDDLRQVRLQGWSGDESGGCVRIAAPVRDGTGAVAAALVVTVLGALPGAASPASVVAAAAELTARMHDPTGPTHVRSSGRLTLASMPSAGSAAP